MNDQITELISHLQGRIHENARNKGWWDERDKLIQCDGPGTCNRYARKMVESSMLMLTVSELSEGMEGLRKELKDDHIPDFLMIEAELADAVIRILDHAEAFGYDLAGALLAKMDYNEGRPHLHGGKAF